MLTPWLEFESIRQHLEKLSEATNVDLIRHGTLSDADTIRDTAIAQPLLVASALLSARELLGDTIAANTVVAGHSVGEFGAAALAGVLTDAESLSLVTIRGAAMAAAAAAAEPTSMAAVLGGDAAVVEAALAALDLTPANVNGGGQVVAAGSKAAIAGLVASPPERARVIELQVAGAFHTHFMSPAVDALASAANGISPHEPTAILLSNADGAPIASGNEAVARLVRQVANPVRWDLCMERMLELGVTGIIEVAPGGVLTGLAKRVMKGVPAVALKTPDDLVAARELMEEHA